MTELDAARYGLLREEDGTGEHSEYVEAIARRARGWPLYVVRVASALASGRIRVEDGVDALPEVLFDDYEQFFKQLGVSDLSQVLTPLFATLHVAEEALGIEELSELLAHRTLITEDEDGKQMVLDAISGSAGMISSYESETGARYVLHHEALREFLQTPKSPIAGAIKTARKGLRAAFAATLSGELPKSRAFLVRRGLGLLDEDEGPSRAVELLTDLTLPMAAAELRDASTWAAVTSEVDRLAAEEDGLGDLPDLMRRNQHMIMRGGAAALLSAASAWGRSSSATQATQKWREKSTGTGPYWLRHLNPPEEPTRSAVVRQLCGHIAPIAHAQALRDDAQVFTLTYDGRFKVWDVATGVNLWEFRPSGHETLCAA